MSLQQIRGPVVLEVPTDPAALFLVRALVGRLAERMEFPREEVDRMVLAVDEACTNVIRHAYGNRPDERIELTFCADLERLEVRIRDFAPPADPKTFTSRGLGEVRPGGLGLHFIRAAMDRVEYETPPGGGTLLRMVKFRVKKEVVDR